MRTYDIVKISKAVSQYSEDIIGFDPSEWVRNPLNIALVNNNDDIALFENQHNLVNTVCGHYFFYSRGKNAINAAKCFLEEIFTSTYVEQIVGLTPLENKGALWMNRRLGFIEHGDVETEIGLCRFVMLTKDQWKESNK